jgi:hypothetical protein
MALTNCSINTASLTKTGGAAIGSQNAQLIITPNEGYVISASNFTNNTGSITGVSNITLSDSTSAGAVGNTVLISVDLDDSYVMPSANTTLTIDIDGAASLIQYTVAGTFTSTISNATPSSQSNVAYSATGSANSTATISQLSKTFTASSGHHFEVEPSAVLNATNPDKYTITKARTYTDGRLTAVAFTVTYQFSNESESGDTINFFANAVEFVTINLEISNYDISTLPIALSGDQRGFYLYGDVGAQARLTITDSSSNTYDFSSDTFTSGTATFKDLTIQDFGEEGNYAFENITFPASTGTYTFVFHTNVSGNATTINDQIDGSPNNDSVTFSITQGSSKKITVGVVHVINENIDISENFVANLQEGSNKSNDPENSLDISFTITSAAGPLRVVSQPATSNFTNTSSSANGGTDINITSVSLTLSTDKSSVIAKLTGNIGLVGNADVVSLLDISNFVKLNTKTIVFDDIVTCVRNGSTVLSLVSEDSDGDTMTHSIIKQPVLGTLGAITLNEAISGTPSKRISDVVYTNNDISSDTDIILYKANDGSEDSAIGTIKIDLTNAPPNATDQAISCKRGGFTSSQVLNVTDPDDSNSNLTYSLEEETDANGSLIVHPPSDGLVTFGKGSTPTIRYTNNANVTQATDNFKYRVTDPSGGTDTATVTVNLISSPSVQNQQIEVDQGAGSTSAIVLSGTSPTLHNPVSYFLTQLPTRGTLHYQSNFSDTALTASSSSALTSNNLFYNHTASNATNDLFGFKVKDTQNFASRTGFVTVNVNEVPQSRFYGPQGAYSPNDDTQSGTAYAPSIVGPSVNLAANTQSVGLYNQAFSMITVGSTSTLNVSVRDTANSQRHLYAFKVTLHSASSRANTNEVTLTNGATNMQRIDFSVFPSNSNPSLYTVPQTYDSSRWANIIGIPAGTYYIKITYNISTSPNNTTSAFNAQLTLS